MSQNGAFMAHQRSCCSKYEAVFGGGGGGFFIVCKKWSGNIIKTHNFLGSTLIKQILRPDLKAISFYQIKKLA